MAKHFMLIAGEPSGDRLGGRLMAALSERLGGDVAFSGVGGEFMEGRGLVSLFPMADLSVMGFAEVLPRVPRLFGRIRQAVSTARRTRPDALVTIDAPAFNFRVGRRLAGEGIPLIHYVAPTVWAWRPGRAREVARFLDHILAIFPFEPPYFQAEGLPCTFVGHPVIESGIERGDGAAFRARHGIGADAPLLLALPGSRHSEVSRHLPVLGEALHRLSRRFPALRLATATVPAVAEEVRRAARSWPGAAVVARDEGERFDAFAAADAAIAASGTVVSELALARVPTVVTYRTSALSAWFARRLITVDHISVPNLVLERPILPELLQEDCRPERLVEVTTEILVDRAARDAQSEGLGRVASKLGAGGAAPSGRAAEVILEVIAQGPRRRPA